MVLLAVIALTCLAPQPAEAARRDERATQAASRTPAAKPPIRASTAAAPARATPAKPPVRASAAAAPARAAPARATPARATPARAAPTRATAARTTPQRQTALRPGDVRSQRQGIVVRGAAAAGIPRGAALTGHTASRDQATCTRRNGRTQCATPRERPLAWQAGLPPMSNAQSECPGGTFATLASGHNNVVRCMPL